MRWLVLVFIIGLIIGLIVYYFFGCNSIFAFFIGLISGVLSNLIHQWFFSSGGSESIIKKHENDSIEVKMMVKNNKATRQATMTLLTHAKPSPSFRTQLGKFENLFFVETTKEE